MLRWKICVHKCFYIFFAYAINSFNNNLYLNYYVNNRCFRKKREKIKKKGKEKKEKEMNIVTVWRLQYFCCILQTTVCCIAVQRFMCVVGFFFVLYLCCTLTSVCCFNQYSLMRKIQYCTILSVLCTRLEHT